VKKAGDKVLSYFGHKDKDDSESVDEVHEGESPIDEEKSDTDKKEPDEAKDKDEAGKSDAETEFGESGDAADEEEFFEGYDESYDEDYDDDGYSMLGGDDGSDAYDDGDAKESAEASDEGSSEISDEESSEDKGEADKSEDSAEMPGSSDETEMSKDDSAEMPAESGETEKSGEADKTKESDDASAEKAEHVSYNDIRDKYVQIANREGEFSSQEQCLESLDETFDNLVAQAQTKYQQLVAGDINNKAVADEIKTLRELFKEDVLTAEPAINVSKTISASKIKNLVEINDFLKQNIEANPDYKKSIEAKVDGKSTTVKEFKGRIGMVDGEKSQLRADLEDRIKRMQRMQQIRIHRKLKSAKIKLNFK
jgi:hypothetical protein